MSSAVQSTHTNLHIANGGSVRLFEPSGSGSNYSEIKAGAQAGNVSYTLPSADGSSGQVLATNGSGTLSWATAGSATTVGLIPGGRLTLTSATPVLGSDVTGSTSIYYALYLHNRVPIYDGSLWTMTAFTELTNTTTDNTKNPAAVANNSNYDLFVWNDSGTLRLGRGPAWSSDTSRGTGAGTTELERIDGVWMNKVAITNGPGANRGTYVGSVRSNGTATVDFTFGGTPAAGGTEVSQRIWNMYNRVSVRGVVNDNTDNWSYSTAAFRAMNNSATNRINFIRGMNEDTEEVTCQNVASSDVISNVTTGIGIDSTTVQSAQIPGGIGAVSTNVAPTICQYKGLPGLGYHYYQALEYGAGANTQTWYGDAGSTSVLFSSGMISFRRY